MASVKDAFLRLIELSLYGHGVLHFIELGFAIYEEAYITASIAGFGALTMVLGALTIAPVISESSRLACMVDAYMLLGHDLQYTCLRISPCVSIYRRELRRDCIGF